MENPEKKILLFLVEGSTDSTSLGLVMSRLVETADVRFAVLGGISVIATALRRKTPQGP